MDAGLSSEWIAVVHLACWSAKPASDEQPITVETIWPVVTQQSTTPAQARVDVTASSPQSPVRGLVVPIPGHIDAAVATSSSTESVRRPANPRSGPAGS